MDTPSALHGLTPEELARLTETHVTTARRWLRTRRAPRAILAALSVLRFGDLGAVSPDWDGWRIQGEDLVSPEGAAYTPAMVRSGPLYERAAAELRAQLSGSLRAAESAPERLARLAALAALVNAHAAARTALDALAEGLTPAERERFFSALDSTRRARARLTHPENEP